MSTPDKPRRQFLETSVALGVGSVLASSATSASTAASLEPRDEFTYEVVRSEEEWRGMFDEDTYKILREGDTEWPKSSEWWDDYRDGHFACRGCNLINYESTWRANVKKGWVFFSQSVPNTLLMSIDGITPDGMADDKAGASTEVHCRRCGSHMGHILKVNNKVLHCINGKALDFTPA